VKKPHPHFSKQRSIHQSDTPIPQIKIFEDLEIPQRTQCPPSEELIAQLNHIASLPPFCYTQKPKENDPR
jgi:hypothetical protein